jgi:hypothetical protein
MISTLGELYSTDITFISAMGKDELYYLPLDISGWVAPLVTNRNYSFEWIDADLSSRQFNLKYSQPEYMKEYMNKTKEPETITIQFTPYNYDYIPYSFSITYGNDNLIASVNETLLLNMSDSKYIEPTLSILFSTKGADLSLADPFSLFASEFCTYEISSANAGLNY